MKRIAFFVEGQTEELFLIRFIEEIVGKAQIAIKSQQGVGGGKSLFSWTEIRADSVTANTKYFILINNCCGDAKIRSHIEDQRADLIKAGYSKIIGIRDVYPVPRADLHKLKYGLYYELPQKPIEIEFVLSTMEIEAWFLSEHTHYVKIDPKLTSDFIHTSLNFHPENDDMEARETPAKDLDDLYKLGGKSYKKKKEQLMSVTLDSLDFSLLYFSPKPASLIQLKGELDSFFF